jgi:catechol 2,3-dioxygenase-like lactoylglutathione lyase family enzyme
MHFNHLGLPVRDERRSLQFYSAYFGFDPTTARRKFSGHGGIFTAACSGG